MSEQPPLSLRDLYPHFSDSQLAEADETLGRYLEMVLRIYERMQADSETYPQPGPLPEANGTLALGTPPDS